MTESGSGRRVGTGGAQRYGPEESLVVVRRLLQQCGEREPFQGQTEGYWQLRCPGCGKGSLRIYKDSGKVYCASEECERLWSKKSIVLFAAVAALGGYDRTEDKQQIWERIRYELNEHERLQSEESRAYVNELEQQIVARDEQLEDCRNRLSEKRTTMQRKDSAAQEEISGLQAEIGRLRQQHQAQNYGEAKAFRAVVAAALLVAGLAWIVLVQWVFSTEVSVVVNAAVSAVVAAGLAHIFYRRRLRELKANPLAEPFYLRMLYHRTVFRTLRIWIVHLVVLVAPAVLIYLFVGRPEVAAPFPIGNLWWKVGLTTAAMLWFIYWVRMAWSFSMDTPSGEQPMSRQR